MALDRAGLGRDRGTSWCAG